MKKTIITMMCLLATAVGFAQEEEDVVDTTTFKGYYYNKDYDVYIRLDAYGARVTVPGQEVFGELPGFFGDSRDARKWLITSIDPIDHKQITLNIVNDYGSEDLEATFSQKNDSVFVLKQGSGSTIKIARDHKWVKMPRTMEFVKRPEATERRRR